MAYLKKFYTFSAHSIMGHVFDFKGKKQKSFTVSNRAKFDFVVVYDLLFFK